jgi:hypothetical protein
MMRGIAFVSGEMAADGAAYVENFVILFNNGKLYTCTVTYKGNTKTDISVSLGDYVETGLDASNGASMTLVAENKLTIALKTDDGVALYSYDLTTNTATKLCDVAGANKLVALSLLSDVQSASAAANKVTGSTMTVSGSGSGFGPRSCFGAIRPDGADAAGSTSAPQRPQWIPSAVPTHDICG